MQNIKKLIAAAVAVSSVCALNAAAAEFDWAADAVEYCVENKIISGNEHGDLLLGSNLTREQMAKILVESFDIVVEEGQTAEKIDNGINRPAPNGVSAEEITAASQPEQTDDIGFSDISSDRWSKKYIAAFKPFMKIQKDKFNPEEYVTREEFISSIVLASGLTEGNIRNRDILEDNFDDYKEVSKEYRTLMCIAVERGYVQGADEKLRPQDLLNRAEASTLLHRILLSKEGKLTLELGVKKSETLMMGASQVPVEQAIQWAKNNNADQRFINVAVIYWKYGELTGLRPELLYAQAAKETGYGRYGGAVLPEQNNWAGIKTATAVGDATYDHESFATPDDGVRAHFNHMGAYVGNQPIGEPHGRYYSVSKIAWAGSVTTLEELGGKWCPDLYYGYSILHNYLEPMTSTEYTPLSDQLLEQATSGEKFNLGE